MTTDATPLTVSRALDDPRVRAGTHWVDIAEREHAEHVQWRINGHALNYRALREDGWSTWVYEEMNLADLDEPATIIPAEVSNG